MEKQHAFFYQQSRGFMSKNFFSFVNAYKCERIYEIRLRKQQFLCTCSIFTRWVFVDVFFFLFIIIINLIILLRIYIIIFNYFIRSLIWINIYLFTLFNEEYINIKWINKYLFIFRIWWNSWRWLYIFLIRLLN
jgi:hypothetical protein